MRVEQRSSYSEQVGSSERLCGPESSLSLDTRLRAPAGADRSIGPLIKAAQMQEVAHDESQIDE